MIVWMLEPGGYSYSWAIQGWGLGPISPISASDWSIFRGFMGPNFSIFRGIMGSNFGIFRGVMGPNFGFFRASMGPILIKFVLF